MSYDLSEINYKAKNDPQGFVLECDMEYNHKVRSAADMIETNLSRSPIVLLSGPSGSGKTTTAMKIEDELKTRGIKSYPLSMDCYFKTVGEDSPKTAEGKPDLESPLCVDMELLSHHFDMLYRGEEITIPFYNFATQRRDEDKNSGKIRLGPNEIVVVEGIHALNDSLTSLHPKALKLYISARSIVEDDGELVFKGTWMRLVRRVVRDSLFRGAKPEYTFGMWDNVRRGEKANISPFKDKANYKFDSSFPCEVSIFKKAAQEFFKVIPEGTPRYEELCSLYGAFDLFEAVSPEYLPPASLLREFIGGGKYTY